MREKIAIIIGVAMAVGAWVMFQQLGPPPQPTTQILVAAHDIAAYESISQSDIRWKTIPTEAVDPGWITSPESALGKVALMSLLSGEPIHAEKLADADQTITSGYRVVAIPTNLVASAGGHIQPGDVVDIYYTPKSGQTPAGVLVSGVTVLDIRTTDNKPYRLNAEQRRGITVTVAGEQLSSSGLGTPGIVVLRLKPEVIPTVLQATETGLVALAQRAPDDRSVMPPASFEAIGSAVGERMSVGSAEESGETDGP